MDADLLLQRVVLHTDSQYCYVGTLTEVNDSWLKLEKVIAIDGREIRLSLDQVLLECRREHHQISRRKLLVPRGRLVSISLLADVVTPGEDD